MKKLVIVLGSIRPNSVSTELALEAEKGAKEAGYEVVTYNLQEMNIKGCMGCGSCRANGTDCVIRDDMRKYYKDLEECEAVLVTAPNYYGHIAGHVVTFMNRHYCMTNADRSQRLRPGIKFAGIFTQGAPESKAEYKDEYSWFMNVYKAKGMDIVGEIICGGGSDMKQKKEDAYKLFL